MVFNAGLLYRFIDVLAPMLVPHKLLDLGVMPRPIRRALYLGRRRWLSGFIRLAQHLPDHGHILGDFCVYRLVRLTISREKVEKLLGVLIGQVI